jgi:predicted trehalose synthase
VNFGPLCDALSRLEGLFSTAEQRRREILATYGPGSLAADAALADLKAQLAQATTQARAAVQTAFHTARQDADAAQAESYADWSRSRDGEQFRATMGMYGPLADRMDADDLAARIGRASRAGLTGEARALVELGSYHPKPTPALRTALANTDVRSEGERNAADASAKLEAASQRFNLYDKLAVNKRTEAVFAGRPQPYSGSFRPDVVLEGGALDGQSNVTVG